MFTLAEKQYLELYKVGVWNKPLNTEVFTPLVDWKRIFEIAKMQTMTGILAQVVSNMPSFIKPEKSIYLNLIAQAHFITNSNKTINTIFTELYKACKELNLQVFLLKGQSIAQYYPNPFLRTSGDIDLFFPIEEDYRKALTALYSYIKGKGKCENATTKHTDFIYKGVVIELHGAISGRINAKCNRNTKAWVAERFAEDKPIITLFENEEIPMPSANFNALFIFLHAARHYFHSAIGLRQITDWVLFYQAQKDKINVDTLLKDLEWLGLTKIWSVFCTMVVNHLGCPKNLIPLYNASYSKEAETILRFILDSGNFGYHDKSVYTNSKNLFIQKAVALKGHISMQVRNIKMFPNEALFDLPMLFIDGFDRFFKLYKYKMKQYK